METVLIGDQVEVFQKPFTKEQREGWGIVTKIFRQNDESADVSVMFADEPEQEYQRTIVF